MQETDLCCVTDSRRPTNCKLDKSNGNNETARYTGINGLEL